MGHLRNNVKGIAARTKFAKATTAGDEFRDVLSGPEDVEFGAIFHEPGSLCTC